METNDVKKVVEMSFNFYEQISDKIVNDAIDKWLGTEEILGAVTELFLNVFISSELSLEGIFDPTEEQVGNKHKELIGYIRPFFQRSSNSQH